MAMDTLPGRDVLLHIHDLSDPNMQLDLTSDPWMLQEGHVSNLVGLDIVNPGRYRPEKGKISANLISPSGASDITQAFPGLDSSGVTRRLTYVLNQAVTPASLTLVEEGLNNLGRPVGTNAYVGATQTITATAHGISNNHTQDRVGIYKPSSHQGIFVVNDIPTANTIQLTGASGSDATLTVWAYMNHRSGVIFLSDTTVTPAQEFLVKTNQTYIQEGAWPAEIVGASVVFDEDERYFSEQNRVVTARTTVFQTNDAIRLSSSGTRVGGNLENSKVTILYTQQGDLRGMWVTNGQKFWILQNGTFNLKLDLTGVATVGDSWRMTKIASNRVMFVSPKHAPRIVYLNDPNTTVANHFERLAGTLPPKKVDSLENNSLDASLRPTWSGRPAANVTGPLGALTQDADYLVQTRAVNLEDGGESEFADVYAADTTSVIAGAPNPTKKKIRPLSASSHLKIGIEADQGAWTNNFVGTPHNRWTHIEVWRTVANGTTYFLESRIAMARRKGATDPENFIGNEDSTGTDSSLVVDSGNIISDPVLVSDTNIITFPAKTSGDITGGRLPPMCKDVASVNNVTFCFGKADSTVVNPSTYVYGYHSNDGFTSVTDKYKDLDAPFAGYRFETGDELLIYDGGIDVAGDMGAANTYSILSRDEATIDHARRFDLATVTSNDAGGNVDFTADVTDRNLDGGNSPLIEFEGGGTEFVLRVQFSGFSLVGEIQTNPTEWAVYAVVESTHTASSTIRMVAYNGATSVTTTGAIDQTMTDLTVGSDRGRQVLRFPLTATFANQLADQGGGTSWAVRFFVQAGAGTEYRVEEVWMTKDTTLNMQAGFTSVFGNLASDYREPRAFIRRTTQWPWPQIVSDEEFYHSRPDKEAPESFVSTRKTLSRRGDTFRRAVTVGNYVAVVMDQGVHLVFVDSTSTVRVDTIATHGEGTPWADSVVVAGNVVVWATPLGPKVLKVSNDPNIEGERGVIAPLGGERFKKWFTDAHTAGETVDAGVDTYNGCIRFRRRINTGKGTNYQALQYSFRTDRWTLIDDDSGVGYSVGLNAVASPPSGERLYSVTAEGNIFEVNRSDGNNHQYVGSTVQATLDGTYTLNDSYIEKTGAFSGAMRGDIVRIKSTNAGRNDSIRRIVLATADRITFDSAITGFAANAVADGDSYRVGAIRFKVKYAPFRGKLKHSVKTLRDVKLVAEQGFKGTPTGNFTTRIYQNFETTPISTGTLDIFNHGATGKKSSDRFVGVEGQGVALELELEVEDTRTDFAVEQVEVRLEEERDEIIDEDTA